jgi:hypothetical protein
MRDERIPVYMRTTAVIVLSLSLLLLGIGSCTKSELKSPRPVPAASTTPTLPPAEAGPFLVIGHLQHRDQIVTIKTGEQGTVYSVQNKDGKVLFENLTAEQLKTQSPETHGFIEAAEAGSADLRPSKSNLVIPSDARR